MGRKSVWNESRREAQKRRRARLHAEKYGEGAGDQRKFHPALLESLKKAKAVGVASLMEKAKTKFEVTSSGCWEWSGYRSRAGYGFLNVDGKRTLAHRWFYATRVGPVEGMCVLHRCDNPPCVNPDHLFLGTQADNVADMTAKGRSVKRSPRGSESPRSKLTEDQVREIRRRVSNGESRKSLAREYGVAFSLVNRIVVRKAWAWLDKPDC